MTWQLHPLLSTFVSAAHADPEAAQLAATWLIDECEPAPALHDVLLWYASLPGDEPRWEHAEAKFQILRAWQGIVGGEPMAEHSLTLKRRDGGFLWRVYPCRERQVFAMLHPRYADMQNVPRSWTIGSMTVAGDGTGVFMRALRLETSRAVRESKRCVLARFPAVSLDREQRFTDADLAAVWQDRHRYIATRLQADGWRMDLKIEEEKRERETIFRQRVFAKDWIAAEARREEDDSGIPAGVRVEMQRYGIDLDSGDLRPISMDLARRGMIDCPCGMPAVSAKVSFGGVPLGDSPRSYSISRVRIENLLFANAGRHVRYWFGQCGHCRRVYWAREAIAEPEYGVSQLAGNYLWGQAP